MKLSKKKAIVLHRELWDWLYHHPLNNKYDWPRWTKNGGDIPEISVDCFLCEYETNHRKIIECEKCPLLWPKNGKCADKKTDLYNKWSRACISKIRKRYAALIRDLGEK